MEKAVRSYEKTKEVTLNICEIKAAFAKLSSYLISRFHNHQQWIAESTLCVTLFKSLPYESQWSLKNKGPLEDAYDFKNYTVSQKTKQICICHNFVKYPPNLMIFGRKTAKRLKLWEMHSFSTSPNLCHNTTMWNADVPNCHTTL